MTILRQHDVSTLHRQSSSPTNTNKIEFKKLRLLTYDDILDSDRIDLKSLSSDDKTRLEGLKVVHKNWDWASISKWFDIFPKNFNKLSVFIARELGSLATTYPCKDAGKEVYDILWGRHQNIVSTRQDIFCQVYIEESTFKVLLPEIRRVLKRPCIAAAMEQEKSPQEVSQNENSSMDDSQDSPTLESPDSLVDPIQINRFRSQRPDEVANTSDDENGTTVVFPSDEEELRRYRERLPIIIDNAGEYNAHEDQEAAGLDLIDSPSSHQSNIFGSSFKRIQEMTDSYLQQCWKELDHTSRRIKDEDEIIENRKDVLDIREASIIATKVSLADQQISLDEEKEKFKTDKADFQTKQADLDDRLEKCKTIEEGREKQQIKLDADIASYQKKEEDLQRQEAIILQDRKKIAAEKQESDETISKAKANLAATKRKASEEQETERQETSRKREALDRDIGRFTQTKKDFETERQRIEEQQQRKQEELVQREQQYRKKVLDSLHKHIRCFESTDEPDTTLIPSRLGMDTPPRSTSREPYSPPRRSVSREPYSPPKMSSPAKRSVPFSMSVDSISPMKRMRMDDTRMAPPRLGAPVANMRSC